MTFWRPNSFHLFLHNPVTLFSPSPSLLHLHFLRHQLKLILESKSTNSQSRSRDFRLFFAWFQALLHRICDFRIFFPNPSLKKNSQIEIGGSVDSDNKIHILVVRKIRYEGGFTWVSQYVKFDQIDRLMEEEWLQVATGEWLQVGFWSSPVRYDNVNDWIA